ncbi:3-hydroxy-3-methylglutaryl-coenzyme A reductase [Natranaerofaba carboxydovora]|nr:hydroxymethylglutaryl-CoA reductase, degradative [Natranaerofaba carboxydovora]UMZ74692.1 3-hydroxy-3-methylglutaryl-coenzyme A reductase [Natranaerofaba carboxydovora]
MSSRISGFHKKSVQDRLEIIAEKTDLTKDEIKILKKYGSLDEKTADTMIENVISTFDIPLGIATNFTINDEEFFIPMATEESSVVAAASNAAKIARDCGGFYVNSLGPKMIAQIQLVNVKSPSQVKFKILNEKEYLLKKANDQDPILKKFGGGAEDLEVRVLETPLGYMVVTHLIVDTRDAMGANSVNTMAEVLAPEIEKITGGRVYLRILSNLADKRLVRAYTRIAPSAIGGEEVIEGILNAYTFASCDPYRAATHNKGIMNGISAVAIATGNDFRALEAGAHAYASTYGQYTSLTRWEKDTEGYLVGFLELPIAVGIIGGATAVHPVAKIALKILGAETGPKLAEVIGAVGLAQNLAAVRALATEGIQKGHMSLHAKNIAVMAGASETEVDEVADKMVEGNQVNMEKAKQILEEIRR